MRFLTMAAAAAFVVLGATAQSPLTTIFAENNNGGNGGAVFFDLTSVNGVEITAFDINCNVATVGAPVSMDVYIRDGSSQGFENTSSGWVLAASGSGTTAGVDNPTNIPLNGTICIPGGRTIGVALVLDSNSDHAYTNGDGTNEFYSNADLSLQAGSSTNSPFSSGLVFSVRVFNGAVYYNDSPGCALPPFPPSATEIVGTVEQTPGAGTLSTTGDTFTDNDFLRLAIDDPSGTNAGDFGAIVLNVGIGGSAPIGVTPGIPGFEQLSALSMPMGTATVYTSVVGGPDLSLAIPAGLLSTGDTARFQALVLEPQIGGAFPVLPSTNTIEFTYLAPLTPPPSCVIGEDFEGITASVGNYPAGWSNGAGTQQWEPQSGGTTSSTTGPTSARVGSQYMYCETSTPVGVGDVFELVSDSYTDQTVTQLQFYLSRIGSDIGQLEVLIDDGSTQTVLATYTGPDAGQSQGSPGLEWSLETLALPSPLPASYSFVFRYTTLPVVQFTFYGDIGIDYFCLN